MRSSLALLVVSLALPASTWAALPPSETGRAAFAAFKSLDADMDRTLDRREMLSRGHGPAMDALFVMLDSSGDGRISLEEMQGRGSGALISRLDAYDVNKDGYVTRQEFPNRFDPYLFTALDGNGDGRVQMADIRPSFAGWRADMPREPGRTETAQVRRETPPATRTWCWVPVVGADGWQVEGPVVWGRCRLN